ncbi:hypothetical protein PHYPSEUDO_002066 [Phytophthora pseudosyringae]|uniref:Uncharacterized protein n=1 Tax=Phytophthora pseudosyringae TaxID=221518 RepID=A0A8T1V2I6_9STRA|nr:hypothetical protein PHYPSEUDO_002066 [Phytophthora pseudosyringae]
MPQQEIGKSNTEAGRMTIRSEVTKRRSPSVSSKRKQAYGAPDDEATPRKTTTAATTTANTPNKVNTAATVMLQRLMWFMPSFLHWFMPMESLTFTTAATTSFSPSHKKACRALKYKLLRDKHGHRQYGRRLKCEPFKLSASQKNIMAISYRAARTTVDYKRKARSRHFSTFKGHATKLRELEQPLLCEMKDAHRKQRLLDAGKRKITQQEWEEKLARCDVLRHQDRAEMQKKIIRLEERDAARTATMSKLQTELESVKRDTILLDEFQTARTDTHTTDRYAAHWDDSISNPQQRLEFAVHTTQTYGRDGREMFVNNMTHFAQNRSESGQDGDDNKYLCVNLQMLQTCCRNIQSALVGLQALINKS